MSDTLTLSTFQTWPGALDGLALAALLDELGIELYRRELARWRVLGDLAAELVDRETFAARRRLAARSFAAIRPAIPRPPRRR